MSPSEDTAKAGEKVIRVKPVYDSGSADAAYRNMSGKPDCKTSVLEVTRKYFQESSIHGIKYIMEPGRHWIERLFWLVSIAICWTTAGAFIYMIFYRWVASPVLVSFDSKSMPITEIPFPALTICNMNKVRKSRVEHIDEELKITPESRFYMMEKIFVKEICHNNQDEVYEDEEGDGGHGQAARHAQLMEAHGSQNNTVTAVDHLGESSGGHKRRKRSPARGGRGGGTGGLQLTGLDLQYYLNDLSQPCDEMVLRCHFEGHDRNCSQIFESVITDEGQCCSFNIMPHAIMYRNEQGDIDKSIADRWGNWTMQDGYVHKLEGLGDLDRDLTKEEMPRRAIAPGLHMGLTVMLDMQEHEYYCSGSESMGFKALLHSPVSQPEMIEFGFAIHPGTEAFYTIHPTMIHADEKIHQFDYLKRNCYLTGERDLYFFKEYTYLNCFMECVANYTYQRCGCVGYYMPRNPNYMPVCSPEQDKCMEEATIIVEETASDESEQSETHCKCLPSCTDIEYPHETSVSKLTRHEFLKFPKKIKDNHPEYMNDSYVKNNLAVAHFYFKDLHFMRHERDELYGTIDFFSNIGGLLGLCTGLSALSVMEILYFYTLRLIYNIGHGIRESLG